MAVPDGVAHGAVSDATMDGARRDRFDKPGLGFVISMYSRELECGFVSCSMIEVRFSQAPRLRKSGCLAIYYTH